MSNIKEWGDYDQSAVQQEQEQAKGDGAQWLKPKQGSTLVRFLPPPAGQNSPMLVKFAHFYKSASDPKKMAQINCARRMSGGKLTCPVCDRMWDWEKPGSDPVDMARAKEMYAQLKVLACVFKVDAPEEGVFLYSFGKTIKDKLDTIFATYGDYSHPTKGYPVKLVRKGEGMTTKWDALGMVQEAAPLEGFTPDDLIDLRTHGLIPSAHECLRAMALVDGEEPPDDDAPIPARAKSPGLRDVVEPPKQRKAKRKTAQDDLDEMDD